METSPRCSKCWKYVTLHQSVKHVECLHFSHLTCLDPNEPNFKLCAQCDPEQESVKLPLKDERRAAAGTDIDYVRKPPRELAPYNPELDLVLRDKPSIECLILAEDLHLQDLLHHGATIDVLLKYGYTWDEDLVKFRDLAEPTRDRKDALAALGCTAEHFRDYPEQLPWKKILDKPQDLVVDFGLCFVEEPVPCLITLGGENERPWTMEDLLQLGLQLKDLYKAGLYSYAQFESLKGSMEDIAALGFTQEALDRLYPPKIPPRPKAKAPKDGPAPPAPQNGKLIIFGNTYGVTAKPKRTGLRKRRV